MQTVQENRELANENEDQNSIVEDARLYPEASADCLHVHASRSQKSAGE